MGKKVLYADDQEMVRERVVPMLQAAGADVTEFGILNQAKAAFAPDKYDAVVLDGKLQGDDDGWKWAVELLGLGVHVMVHSTSSRPKGTPPELTYLSKGVSLHETRDFFSQFLSDS